jgi:hypothetical protein
LIQEKDYIFSGVGLMATEKTTNFQNEVFQAIVEQCEGCERIVAVEETKYCGTYVNPGAKWRQGMCNFATHAKPEVAVVTARINPLKAAKRASKRK